MIAAHSAGNPVSRAPVTPMSHLKLKTRPKAPISAPLNRVCPLDRHRIVDERTDSGPARTGYQCSRDGEQQAVRKIQEEETDSKGEGSDRHYSVGRPGVHPDYRRYDCQPS